jgi:hypothetical protein
LKTIKKFFQLLAKQGLYKGQLFLEGIEYRFSVQKGFEQIEGQEVKIPTLKAQAKKKETIKREPVIAEELNVEPDQKQKEMLKVEKEMPSELEPISILSEKPPSERKKNQLFTIISFVALIVVAVFVIIFGINFIKKKPSSTLKDNPQKEETAVMDTESARSETETGEVIIDQKAEFQQYVDRTRDYIVAEDLVKARDSLDKARSINNNELVKKLENEIKTLEKLKSEAAKEKLKKQEIKEKPKTIRTVLVRDLSSRIIGEYLRQLQNIRINLPKKINVSGYINANLQINKEGIISISSHNDAGLIVKPISKKRYVVDLIKSGIYMKKFLPPRDKKNRLVNVKNWRLNFQVSQYKRRMILRKQ